MNTEKFEERLSEDRLERSQARKKRRKKNNTIASILVIFGCLLVLVIVTYIAGIIYMWIDDEFQKSANDLAAAAMAESEKQLTYTQEELDARLAEASASMAADVLAQAEQAREAVLSELKLKLEEGISVAETLRGLYPEDIVLVSGGRYHFVPVKFNLAQNSYQEECLNILENGEIQYLENGEVISHKGIDVSKHQGNIDWKKVAADGVEFAFIRVGFRGYGTGEIMEDEYFEENIKGAKTAGIKVGVYFYTQAVNEAETQEEAEFVLEKIAPYQLDCPVVLDVEMVSGANARMNEISKEERTNLVLRFCSTIEQAGYKPMIYHNMETGVLKMNLEELENYDKWFAYYNEDFYYPYAFDVWQYSDKGRVDGIQGNVDMNISFSAFWEN